MIYIAGTPLVYPSVREILKLIKNNAPHILGDSYSVSQ